MGSRAMKQTALGRVRFGVFELDVKTGELHRQDKTILLQDQSFRLLLALIEREGHLVSREEQLDQRHPAQRVELHRCCALGCPG